MRRVARPAAPSQAARDVPLLLALAVASSVMMLVPAIHALALGDEDTARAFGWTGLLLATLGALVAIALSGRPAQRPARAQLLVLPGFYGVLPLLLAIPFAEATGTPYFAAYVEMVSSLTTTGFTVYDPSLLVAPAHLWRGLVGWAGGLFIWVVAAAILAPMNLGGFEVGASGGAARGFAQLDRVGAVAHPAERVGRFTLDIAPVYVGLTFLLWAALVAAGERPFVAICHAMATLSTSGISPVGGIEAGRSGVAGEVVIALFLVLALSRATFLPGGSRGLRRTVWDAELRLAAVLILGTSAVLFLRHWAGAADEGGVLNVRAALAALWGSLFTVMGYLTTAGFESVYWDAARDWSGAETIGPILVALSLIGGGVATTAGGIKLFRIYALAMHGARELERLSFPSSVGGSGRRARGIRRQGARIAFVFFMLFNLALALTTMALAATGLDFEHAVTLAAAALSNTGPLAQAGPVAPVAPADLGLAARLILVVAMVLGRLEMLAVVALLNPSLWRA